MLLKRELHDMRSTFPQVAVAAQGKTLKRLLIENKNVLDEFYFKLYITGEMIFKL